MPNWCNNYMTISHDNPEMIQKAADAWNGDQGFLRVFIPIPYELELVGGARLDITKITNHEHHKELEAAIRALNKKHFGYEDWYDFCCKEWGTKWDIGGFGDAADLAVVENGSFSVGFDSAWAPPLDAYEKLMEMGFRIKAYYVEFGMDYCGSWHNGISEHYTDMSSADIPAEIDGMMGITETLENLDA